MHWLGVIVIGLVVGLVARFIKPGNDPMGWIMTTLLGIGGALLASYLGSLVGFYHAGEAAGFIASVIGAVILLIIYNLIKSKTKIA